MNKQRAVFAWDEYLSPQERFWRTVYTDILTERLDFKADLVVKDECSLSESEQNLHVYLYDERIYDGYERA